MVVWYSILHIMYGKIIQRVPADFNLLKIIIEEYKIIQFIGFCLPYNLHFMLSWFVRFCYYLFNFIYYYYYYIVSMSSW